MFNQAKASTTKPDTIFCCVCKRFYHIDKFQKHINGKVHKRNENASIGFPYSFEIDDAIIIDTSVTILKG